MNEYVQVARVLTRVVGESQHLDDCFGPSASPLVQQICYGACRYFYLYREVAAAVLDKPLPAKHLDLQMLIIAGLYSMDHLHRPAHASVNRVVEAVAGLKKNWARGMVNAVLRRYGREADAFKKSLSTEALLNHPDWLIQRLRLDWPDQSTLFDCNQQQAPMTLRVNLSRTTRDDYLARLADKGIEALPGQLSAAAVTLADAMVVDALPGFADGEVSVQDEAPQLAPALMRLFEGARVLDACAAPGGKTCHLLESCSDIHLTALDRDTKRVPRITENLERLSLNAKVVTHDLMTWEPAETFDRILLDVPCSATGIIRRHPDIKLLRAAEDIDKLASIQRGLLDKAFDLLGPGGELLYSTCSILKQENDQVVADFLSSADDARLRKLDLPSDASAIQTDVGLQLFPTMRAHDGFYYAAISKVRQ